MSEAEARVDRRSDGHASAAKLELGARPGLSDGEDVAVVSPMLIALHEVLADVARGVLIRIREQAVGFTQVAHRLEPDFDRSTAVRLSRHRSILLWFSSMKSAWASPPPASVSVAPTTNSRKAAAMLQQGTVGAVCVREVVVAEGNESVLELAQLMRHHHVGDVVIVDRRGDKIYPSGIVTDRDIVVDGLVTSLENIGEMKASELVKRSLVSVRENQNLDDALDVMRENGIRRAPVVDDEGALVGMLAVDDIVELFADRMCQLSMLITRQQRIERDDRP